MRTSLSTRHVTRPLLFLLLCCFCAWGNALANTALDPQPRDEKWVARHEGFVAEGKQGNIAVLFLGDSITDFWRQNNPTKGGKAVWDKYFAPLGAANFGISGDRTQHILWRIGHGELDGIQPKALVLLIGTNNIGMEKDKVTVRNTAEEALEGVVAVVNAVRAKLPNTKILLLGIFPRNGKDDPRRAEIAQINASLAKLHDGKSVYFLDIGPKLLEPDGTLSTEVMPDLLHPSEKGYEIWAEAIKEPLGQLLK